jgi:hypothetical protein
MAKDFDMLYKTWCSNLVLPPINHLILRQIIRIAFIMRLGFPSRIRLFLFRRPINFPILIPKGVGCSQTWYKEIILEFICKENFLREVENDAKGLTTASFTII